VSVLNFAKFREGIGQLWAVLFWSSGKLLQLNDGVGDAMDVKNCIQIPDFLISFKVLPRFQQP